MEKIKIEKNIPITRKYAKNSLPFELMEVGDSFHFKFNGEKEEMLRIRLLNAFRSWRIRNNSEMKIKSSLTEDGVRIWRIE